MREAWLAFGRRTAKTLKAATYATYLATIGAEVYGYRDRLTRGERGVVQVLAVDRDQAGVASNTCARSSSSRCLPSMVKRETADTIELSNGIVIEITTNDRRRVRGRTVIAAIFDEVAHWRVRKLRLSRRGCLSGDQAKHDHHAQLAVDRHLLAPCARGLLWRKVNELYGKPGRTLVARAPTWVDEPDAAARPSRHRGSLRQGSILGFRRIWRRV